MPTGSERAVLRVEVPDDMHVLRRLLSSHGIDHDQSAWFPVIGASAERNTARGCAAGCRSGLTDGESAVRLTGPEGAPPLSVLPRDFVTCSYMHELPSVALTQQFLRLCEQYGSQRLAIRIVAVGRATGVAGLPTSDDWTTWGTPTRCGPPSITCGASTATGSPVAARPLRGQLPALLELRDQLGLRSCSVGSVARAAEHLEVVGELGCSSLWSRRLRGCRTPARSQPSLGSGFRSRWLFAPSRSAVPAHLPRVVSSPFVRSRLRHGLRRFRSVPRGPRRGTRRTRIPGRSGPRRT